MDRISKALKKFSLKEKERVKEILKKIYSKKLDNLDIKKLKGRDDIFRVRKGKIRIIYRVTNSEIFILLIERKSDKTYKF